MEAKQERPPLPATPWGIISIKGQLENFRARENPTTMMRNTMISEGGSGVAIDRRGVAASVRYHSAHAPVVAADRADPSNPGEGKEVLARVRRSCVPRVRPFRRDTVLQYVLRASYHRARPIALTQKRHAPEDSHLRLEHRLDRRLLVRVVLARQVPRSGLDDAKSVTVTPGAGFPISSIFGTSPSAVRRAG